MITTTQSDIENVLWRRMLSLDTGSLAVRLAWLRANQAHDWPPVWLAAHEAVCQEIEDHLIEWSYVGAQLVTVKALECGAVGPESPQTAQEGRYEAQDA